MNYTEFEKKYINPCNKLNPDSKEFKDLQEALFKTGNAEYIYDVEYIYWFAKKVKGADIDKCQDALLKIGDAHYIYAFARFIKGADVDKCQEAILKIGNPEYIFCFAKDVKGADINKCQEALLKTKDEKYINLFKKEILKNKQLKFNQ